MKRLIIAALAAGLIGTQASAVSAATPQPKPIQVKLNGEALAFQVAPTTLDSKVFVEFRSLFVALGYQVAYAAATKTVIATSADRIIEMKVGGTSALVNGEKVPVNGDLRSVNGRTLVGVRFIATLSGMNVEWNGTAKLVSISDKGPAAAQKQAVVDAFNRLGAAEAAQDADAFLANFTADARSQIEEGIRAQYASTKTETGFESIHFESYSASEMVVSTQENTNKVSGAGFFADYRGEFVYTFEKDAKGQWLISGIENVTLVTINEDKVWAQAIEAPSADKTAIEALVKGQSDAINAADEKAIRATYVADFADIEDTVQSMTDLVTESGVKTAIKKVAIVSIGNDKAQALVEMTLSDSEGSIRFVTLYDFAKQDGKWLYVDTGSDLVVE